MKNNNKALEKIYQELNRGEIFGIDRFNAPRFPYFDAVLWTNEKYIFWRNYGSSANKNTLQDLAWIIETIFETTPEKFLETYITRDASKINY